MIWVFVDDFCSYKSRISVPSTMDVLSYIFNLTVCQSREVVLNPKLNVSGFDLILHNATQSQCQSHECSALNMEQRCTIKCCQKYCCQTVSLIHVYFLSKKYLRDNQNQISRMFKPLGFFYMTDSYQLLNDWHKPRMYCDILCNTM